MLSGNSPQLITPSGLAVTSPFPSPPLVTARVKWGVGSFINVAIMVWLATIVISHVSASAHSPPLQPANIESGAEIAVKVIVVPAS